MEKPYHIVSKENTEELTRLLVKNGQSLLPMVELIEQSKLAVDELIGKRQGGCIWRVPLSHGKLAA